MLCQSTVKKGTQPPPHSPSCRSVSTWRKGSQTEDVLLSSELSQGLLLTSRSPSAGDCGHAAVCKAVDGSSENSYDVKGTNCDGVIKKGWRVGLTQGGKLSEVWRPHRAFKLNLQADCCMYHFIQLQLQVNKSIDKKYTFNVKTYAKLTLEFFLFSIVFFLVIGKPTCLPFHCNMHSPNKYTV